MTSTLTVVDCTTKDLHRVYAVMRELRPDYSFDSFCERVERILNQGYLLAAVEKEGDLLAVAGYRFDECLAWGKFIYVYDLVSLPAARSSGCGQLLINWLKDQARKNGCGELHLDSGVQRFDAHRFYLRERFNIIGHHFSFRL